MGIQFHGSSAPTLGIEVELQVIDPETRELTQGAPEILARFPDDPHFKPEFIQSNLEINTDICTDIEHARENLNLQLQRLYEVCDELGYVLASAGTHPFSHWRNQRITPKPRYLELKTRNQWTSRRLVIFGIHYHIGVSDGEKAIATLNALMWYIPHMLALSSSSPFWVGVDTGMYSARAKIFEGLPTAGLPYILVNWNEFVWFMNTLKGARAIESIREIWWDIRPHHRYGTLEIRVCDGITRLDDIIAMAGFVQSLVVDLGRRYDQGERLLYLPRWIIQENKWRASRFGPHAEIIRDRQGHLIALKDSLYETLDRLEPVARGLGAAGVWPRLREMVEAPTAADRMRRWFAETGSLTAVVDNLVQELRTNALID